MLKPNWLYISLMVAGFSPFNAQTAPIHAGHAVCNVYDYRAVGDGVALDSAAINSAINDCHARGGGIAKLPSGVFRSGTIFLQDNVYLDVEAGATILGSADLADYVKLSHSSEGRDTALIVAENVHDTGIIGKGTIDGNGRSFIKATADRWTPYFDVGLTRQGKAWADRMGQSNAGPVTMGPRPGVLFLALHVQGLQLQDFRVVDSPNWTLKIGCSHFINANHLVVLNDLRIPNNDAMDISTSSDATISDSYFQAGDDALVIGGPCLDGWCQEKAERIKVHNVTLVSRSAALRVGPAAQGVRDVSFDHIIVRDSNRGITIQTRAAEVVENITFNDIVIDSHLIDGPWWGAGEPITITVAHWDYLSWAKTASLGTVRHLRFSHIVTSSDSPVVLYSTEPGHIYDIDFEGLSLSMKATDLNAILGGNLDLQPTTPIDLGVRRQDMAAILVHNVDKLQLNKVKVRWSGSFPDFYTNALSVDGFHDLTIDHLVAAASSAALPAIHLQNGSGVDIRHTRATAGPLLEQNAVTDLVQK